MKKLRYISAAFKVIFVFVLIAILFAGLVSPVKTYAKNSQIQVGITERDDTINLRIRNTGTTTAYFKYRIYWDTNISAAHYYYPGAMSPNAEIQVTLTLAPPPGAKQIHLEILDARNKMVASSTAGVYYTPPTPTPTPFLPDVSVESISLDANNIAVATLKNIGKGPLLASDARHMNFYTQWYDGNGKELENTSMTSWPIDTQWDPGQTITASNRNARPVGAASVKISLLLDVPEENNDKSNNAKILNFSLPDLNIESIKLDSNNLAVATIQNIGPGPVLVSDARKVGLETQWFDASGKELSPMASWPIQAQFDPGQSIDVSNANARPDEAVSVKMTIDYGQELPEVNNNKSNNVKVYNLSLPDISVDSISLDNNNLAIASVSNIGKGPVLASVAKKMGLSTQWYDGNGKELSDSGMYSWPVQTQWDPGQKLTVSNIKGRPDGAATVKISFALGSDIPEENNNKSNNVKTLNLPQADLAITSLRQDNTTVTVGITNLSTIKYIGDIGISSNWENTAQTSQDLGSVTMGSNEEITKQFTIIQPKKTATLHVTINPSPADDKTDNNSSELTVIGTDDTLKDLTNQDVPSVSNEVASTLETNTASDGAQVDPPKEAGALPGSPWYGVKDFGRKLWVDLTFDPEKKVEGLENIVNQKELETSVLMDNKQLSEAVVSAENASQDTADLTKAVDDLRKKNPKKADDLTIKILGDRLKQAAVIDKLKNNVPVVDTLQVDKAQDTTLTNLGDLVGKIKDTNKVKDSIDSATDTKGSPFKPLKNLVAINAVSSHIANEKIKNLLDQAKEKQQDHLKNDLQNLTPKQLSLFNDYVDKTTGDKVNTLKALDDTKGFVTDKNVRGALGTAKQKTISSLVKDIQDAKKKDPNAANTILGDLKNGNISDLRVLTDLKSKDNGVNNDISSVKKTAITNFEKNVNALKQDQKQKYLASITQDHLDLTQQSVVNDIKQTLPASDISKQMDTTLKTQVKTKLATVSKNKKQYDDFLSTTTSDTSDDKTAITDFTSGFDTSFYKDMLRHQLNYMQAYYDSADPETKKVFDQYYFSDPQIKAFYSDFDGTFNQLFNGTNPSDFTNDSTDNASQDSSNSQDGSTDNNTGDNSSDVQTTSGCPVTDDPVCGKDGLNYPNECEAKANGIEVDYKGECTDNSTSSSNNQSSNNQSNVDQSQSPDNSQSSGDDSSVQGASTKRFVMPAWVPFVELLW